MQGDGLHLAEAFATSFTYAKAGFTGRVLKVDSVIVQPGDRYWCNGKLRSLLVQWQIKELRTEWQFHWTGKVWHWEH